MPDGIETQREELLGSHSSSSLIESVDLKLLIPGSPRTSLSPPGKTLGLETLVSPNPVSLLSTIRALCPLFFTPDPTLPSVLTRSSIPVLTLPGLTANRLIGPASRRMNSREDEWEDILDI